VKDLRKRHKPLPDVHHLCLHLLYLSQLRVPCDWKAGDQFSPSSSTFLRNTISKFHISRAYRNITNSMEQSLSWEAYSHSAGAEIPRLLWNPKVHYRIHNSRPLGPALYRTNPVHTFPPRFLLPTPGSYEWSLPTKFPTKVFYAFLSSHACYTPHPSHPSYLMKLITFGEAYKLWSSSLCSLLHSPSTSSLSGPNILSAPCSQTPSVLCFSLSVTSSFTPVQRNR
jgi:hypothetical protein